ncbi:MAG: hypothetical protein H0W33_06820, partial [Gammaproteobacteria bacterium]|nr:hypothetical protein [Gammaproteobacteria bacterium]
YSTPYDAKLDPDAFFTFGEYWNLAEWGLPAEVVEPVGFKYILDRRARFPGGAARRGSKVMLVSQPHISRALGAVFGTVVKHRPDVQFILKLHPQDVDRWWERYPCGREMNVQVPVEPSSDLYALFAECRCVIGYDSTVLFEASFFGLAVGILNLDGRNRCSALEFDGRYNFHEIRDPGQIDDLLGAEQSSCEYDANPFFAAFDKARFQRLMGIVA